MKKTALVGMLILLLLATSSSAAELIPLQQQDAYCYAVVVNNTSNDGTFIPAINYLP